RSGHARFQLRVQPIMRVRRALGMSAGTAREPAVRRGRGGRAPPALTPVVRYDPEAIPVQYGHDLAPPARRPGDAQPPVPPAPGARADPGRIVAHRLPG